MYKIESDTLMLYWKKKTQIEILEIKLQCLRLKISY